MARHDTPGVYFERGDASAGGVSALRTDVAGFVGIAERGPLNLAVPVESYRQFVAWFGGPIATGYLAYCARAFFENGGRRLWAVRVVSEAASTAAAVWYDSHTPVARPAWRIEASSPGVWGSALAVRLTETRRTQLRATLDPVDARRLAVSTLAGIERYTLLEIASGAVRFRAVVAAIDAPESQVLLRDSVAGLDHTVPLWVSTVGYSVEVFASGQLVALYEDLSLVPEHPRYGPAILAMPWHVFNPRAPESPALRAPEPDVAADYFRVARNRATRVPPPVVIRELRDAAARANPELLAGVAGTAPTAPVPLIGGADGSAALSVRDFIGEAVAPDASDVAVLAARRGLAALALVDEVAILAVPDIHIRSNPPPRFDPPQCVPDPCLPAPGRLPATPAPAGDAPPIFSLDEIYQVQAALIAHCEARGDRVALLDMPFEMCSALTFAAAAMRTWRSRFDSAFAALYAPWLRVVDPIAGTSALTRAIPPCGHVAGLYAATDLKRGVHVAPANTPLEWLQDVTLAVDATLHGLLNTLGINIVRAETGRGLRVLGARTVASDPDWRFVTVRRLVCMLRRALDFSLQWAVFEPNDWRLRNKLALGTGFFLHDLWMRGALVGTTPDEAFFVRCDASNNPADSRDRGQLVLDVGVAPSVPFEFIVLRIGRDANGFALTENPAQALTA